MTDEPESTEPQEVEPSSGEGAAQAIGISELVVSGLIILAAFIFIGAGVAFLTGAAKQGAANPDDQENGEGEVPPGEGGGECPTQPTALPIRDEDVEQGVFNNTPHGRSISHPGAVSHHNVAVRRSNDYGARQVDNEYGEAVDVGIQSGNPVYAPISGKVVYAGPIHRSDPRFGDMVVMESDNAADNTGCIVAGLLHLDGLTISRGQTVVAGTQIGTIFDLSGCSGCVDHLHFELWTNGQPINVGTPARYGSDDSAEIWRKQREVLQPSG